MSFQMVDLFLEQSTDKIAHLFSGVLHWLCTNCRGIKKLKFGSKWKI